MKRGKQRIIITGIPIVGLILTVPWFFVQENPRSYFGFPDWAFYSFVATISYGLIVAYLIERHWDVLGDDDDD